MSHSRSRTRDTDLTIELCGQITHETDRAWLFHDGDREVWLPKSQCHWDEGGMIMTVPQWLAIEKELA